MNILILQKIIAISTKHFLKIRDAECGIKDFDFKFRKNATVATVRFDLNCFIGNRWLLATETVTFLLQYV
ncbi:MAG: hypothetical protein LBP59_13435 [Planctomycetaceae bacterium]|nr:hypothetical protein [Planctomycetaceae bacterium]